MPLPFKGDQVFSKVKLKKGALNHFRKKAREAFPLEIQAYLLGTVNSIDSVEIEEFCYPKTYYVQNTGEVAWSREEYAALQSNAEEKGLKILGDIHSHPNWDAVMSPADYKNSVTESLVICGICSVYGKKTRVRFWTPTSSLPCKIIEG